MNKISVVIMTLILLCSFAIMPVLAEGEPAKPAEPAKGLVNLSNPLETLAPKGNIISLMGNLVNILLGFIGSLSLLFVVLGGYRLLISRGNPEEIKKGQATITWAVIGVVMSLLSYAVISLVIKIVSGTA